MIRWHSLFYLVFGGSFLFQKKRKQTILNPNKPLDHLFSLFL